jgi:hypothetical protein
VGETLKSMLPVTQGESSLLFPLGQLLGQGLCPPEYLGEDWPMLPVTLEPPSMVMQLLFA